MQKLRPYSRAVTWGALDGRSREARFMRRMREDLTAHVGGSPSATQKALIERCATLSLHIELMDERRLKIGGQMTDHDSRQYLAWSNSLERSLRRLGLVGAAAQPKTLADRYADRGAA